jgi:phosphohistidine swiveling domain-containing protein
LSSEAAVELRRRGEGAILARVETSSEDILGIQAAAGVLTVRGGMTSHAAVVARGMGRSAVVGVSGLQIDYARQELRTREHVVRRGEVLTIDGNSGEVLLGAVPLRAAHLQDNPDYAQLMAWADQGADLRVLAQADTPVQAQLCRDLGLRGLGLSRCERWLCHPERVAALRELCERPQHEAARSRLAEALGASYRQLLRVVREGELMLRLLDPAAARALLAAADCELDPRDRAWLTAALLRDGDSEQAPGAGVLWGIWVAQLRGLVAAATDPGLPAGVPPPVVLVPSCVALSYTAAVAAQLSGERTAAPGGEVRLGALCESPKSAGWPELVGRLAVLGFVDCEPDAATVQQLRTAAGPGAALALGLYPPGGPGEAERAVATAARLGLDYIVVSPLRAPIARLLAAQVRLQDPHLTEP